MEDIILEHTPPGFCYKSLFLTIITDLNINTTPMKNLFYILLASLLLNACSGGMNDKITGGLRTTCRKKQLHGLRNRIK
jgi:hypothetical protein